MDKKRIKFNLIVSAAMLLFLLMLDGAMLYAFALLFVLLFIGLWFSPAPMTKRSLEPGFQAAFEHDYIALDTTNRRLWIRDPKRGNRYLGPEDIKMIRTAFDETRPGRIHQRIEVEIEDLEHPVWHVWFERHPESRIKGSNRNKEERDEWFARLKTWAQMKNLP